MSSLYCPECGISIDNDVRFCPNCGADQRQGQKTYKPQLQTYRGQNTPPYGYQSKQSADPSQGINPIIGIAILIFPLIGLVTYFAYKNGRPRASSQSCSIAIAGFLLGFVLNFALFL